MSLQPAKSCELHVHLGGCLTAEDLVELSRDTLPDIDWTYHHETFEKAFGVRPNPDPLLRNAQEGKPGGLRALEEHFHFTEADGGDFGRFSGRMSVLYCVLGHEPGSVERSARAARLCVDRHRSEGIDYIEYRCMTRPEQFEPLHIANAEAFADASDDAITARYVVSLRRDAALEDYHGLRRILQMRPDLGAAIAGIDFCHVEEGYPPKILRPFFQRLARDNASDPNGPLDVLYHVGESFFDKSLESAVRWCHEAAELGASRLGHAIALGLDSAVAVARRPNAHEAEPASERLDQVEYDLRHADGLAQHGVRVDRAALAKERGELRALDPDEIISRIYDEPRLEDIRRRQGFVLDALARLGTVIETCPTSNLRIGGVPDPAHHPVHRFLASGVDLVICADDPGVFATTLADEVEWVLEHSGLSEAALAERLGDPHRFRLRRASRT